MISGDDTAAALARENAKALFAFLKEFTDLRMSIVRNVDDYENVLWICNVPKEKECSCAAWSLGREGEEKDETWLEIRKPRLVSPPRPDASLEPWLVAEQIGDSSRDMPELREEISIRIQDDEGNDERFERRRIEDHSEIRQAWTSYVEDQWWPWAENDRRNQKIQAVYTQLFTIYQRQQRLGEEYEVALGLGLLDWQPPDEWPIRRHILTARANIHFEAARGVIRVGPAGEGARPQLEQDMLDPKQRPEPSKLDALEGEVSEIGDDVWDPTKLHTVLAGWVHSVSPKGIYRELLELPGRANPDPTVHLAPAILLRKRADRSFVRAFQEIIQQLEQGASVPPALAHFVVPAQKRDAADSFAVAVKAIAPPEIYFPLEANEEQKTIVERLWTGAGVLVQGPPGTGKSHTIVNLICHLLASGKRILVTSHTPRALRVLKRFLEQRTPEIAPLSVVLLGDDRDSLEAMERSVQGIMDRHNLWDQSSNHNRIVELERDLRDAREKESNILGDIRAIRERETYEHPVLFGSYQGTLQKIGEKLRSENQFSWMEERPPEDAEPPLGQEEFSDLLELLRDESIKEATRWTWEAIDPRFVLAPDKFRMWVAEEDKARQSYEKSETARHHAAYQGLLSISDDARKSLSDSLDSFLKDVDEINRHLQPWVSSMIREILGDLDRPWREVYDVTKDHLAEIGDRARWIDETPASGLDGKDLTTVKHDAESMLQHFAAGGGWSIWGFRSEVAKRALYLRDNVRIGGQLCTSEQALRNLVSWIDVFIRL
jgi:hypothetical protein